jgi:hypothetical protein
MSRVCILTDGTAQFLQVNFPSSEHVCRIGGGNPAYPSEGTAIKEKLPPGKEELSDARLSTELDFLHAFQRVERQYHEILVLLGSSWLNPSFRAAQAAACKRRSKAIHIINS